MNPYAIIAAIGVTILLVVGAFFYGQHVKDVEWRLVAEKSKKEAAQTLEKETAKVLEAERRNVAITQQLEKKHADEIADLDRKYAAARADAARAGGLRDPGRRAGCSCPAPSQSPGPTGRAEGTSTGGALSAEAQQFLFEFAREADQLVLDLRACREHVLQTQ